MRDYAAGVPILGVVGINGAGKTLVGATLVVMRLRAGRDVYSTVPVYDPVSGRSTTPILGLEDLLGIRNATVFFDDVAVILPSGSMHLPEEVEVLLQTLRHKGVDVIWTAPGWMRASNRLRLVTQGLLNVVPFLRVRDDSTPWPRPRAIALGLMDTTTGKADSAPEQRLGRVRFMRPEKLEGWGTYDTLADTPVLTHRKKPVTLCEDCNGVMSPPRHSKARHDALGLVWRE